MNKLPQYVHQRRKREALWKELRATPSESHVRRSRGQETEPYSCSLDTRDRNTDARFHAGTGLAIGYRSGNSEDGDEAELTDL